MNEHIQTLDSSAGYGGDALQTQRNKVLRNTYLLLALSLLPTVLGAWLGVATGITKSEITRASQWLKSRDRDDTLVTLIESGDITTGMRGSSTRQAMVYRLTCYTGRWRDTAGRIIHQKQG